MKVLIVVTSIAKYRNHNIPTGLWLSELTHLYAACVKNNILPVIVSPKGGNTPLDPESLKPLVLDKLTKKYFHDPEFMKLLNNTASLDSININEFDAIYLTGGHGTMYDFVGNPKLNQIVASFYENGKIVSAVCHGVCGLIDVKLGNGDFLVKDKTLTGYSWFEEILAFRKRQVPFNLEKTLKERGANYKKAIIPLTSNIEQDKNLITGQNPFSSKAIAKRIVEALKQKSHNR
jgi:putative intracellular protease/amidase